MEAAWFVEIHFLLFQPQSYDRSTEMKVLEESDSLHIT